MTNFFSFGSGDYDRIVGAMKDRPFNPQCYTKTSRLLNRLDRHSHSKKNRISSIATTLDYTEYITSGKMLNTQKRLLEKRPTSYRKNKVLKLESQITELCEHDRISYQEKNVGSRNCGQIYKHLKHISRASNIPKLIKFKDKKTSIQKKR